MHEASGECSAPVIRVIFRLDANSSIGIGHARRCLALAQALQKHSVQVTFLVEIVEREQDQPGAPEAWLLEATQRQGIGIHWLSAGKHPQDSLPEVIEWLERQKKEGRPVDWLVVDHYQLDLDWEQTVLPHVKRLCILEDTPHRPHVGHCLVDGSAISIAPEAYREQANLRPEMTLLLGAQYTLLSDAFMPFREEKAQPGKLHHGQVEKILVCAGGSDPMGLTEQLLQALATHPLLLERRVTVVLGPLYPTPENVYALCNDKPHWQVWQNPSNMAQLLAEHDFYLGAGGTITWERCCVGLPGLVVPLVENQRAQSQLMAKQGAQWVLLPPSNPQQPEGWQEFKQAVQQSLLALFAQPEAIQAMAEQSFRQVDGQGSHRVAKHLIKPCLQKHLSLRQATEADARLMWQWRNHTDVRRYAFDPEPIAWEAHQPWWSASLKNPQRLLLIAEQETTPEASALKQAVGLLRFDWDHPQAETCTVSIYLDPTRHGQGLGPILLKHGLEWIRRYSSPTPTVLANVRADNPRSQHAFTQAGFQPKHIVYHYPLGSLDSATEVSNECF
ncbi:MAG: UDP-2,4-diacetamido-2,4,6-trideoxy-beta-L-altropyranose hydrolase [Candidatus Melainabacteria bacterium]|nr:UDP-2,4-diacetamido-2,4,6-trideoxy-beta-L-altropyranose hydrolase [Candidatus Melainabacteria bacterium]